MSRLIIHVDAMISMPKMAIKKVARRAVRIPHRFHAEAARILVHNGVQEALVEDSSPGMVNQTDIVRDSG